MLQRLLRAFLLALPKQLVYDALDPEWVVNDMRELGMRVLNLNMYYYKWSTPLVYDLLPRGKPDGKDPAYRAAYKREFGETIQTDLVDVQAGRPNANL